MTYPKRWCVLAVVVALGSSWTSAGTTDPTDPGTSAASSGVDVYTLLDQVPMALARRAAAEAMERRAFADLQMAFNLADQDFRRRPDAIAAFADANDTYRAYVAARERVLRTVWARSDYQGYASARDRLAEKILNLRTDKRATERDLLATASLKLQFAAAAGNLELAALAESEEVGQARERMIQAASVLGKLQADYKYELPRRPEVVEVRERYRDARITTAAAQAEVYGRVEVAREAIRFTEYILGSGDNWDGGDWNSNSWGGYYTPRSTVVVQRPYFGYGANMR